MITLKTFENYDPKLHKSINGLRDLNNTNFMKNLYRITSIIDDIFHFDFNNIKINNTEGFRKASKLFTEIGLLKAIYKRDNDVTKDDLIKYDFDIDEIFSLVEDPEVINYFDQDTRGKKRYDELIYLLDLLKD